ncbi:ThiF family adenylyltransferase [Streptomyces sp. NPDC001941]|uniref:HesA/MoeB/ThiF family protein n=1 Tax=Streptomyces sp. NPDC001941 TaxID=3154659 RepID=UPI003325D53B
MQRPRVKSVFPPLPAGEGRIRIGSDFGIASELQDDEQGHTWYLLDLLDGTRGMAEVTDAMREFDPSVAPGDVEAAVGALVESGFVEDAAERGPVDRFSSAELERYRRNLEFFEYFHRPPLTSAELQLRLKQARVTVLGLGGLGANVAMSLAAIGVGHLTLVDHDKVELMNLNRQLLYGDADIGRAKSEAAAERVRAINPHITVEEHCTRVDGPEDAARFMTGQSLLICAADRPRILLYQWLNKAGLATGVPWMRGANDGLTVNLFLHVPRETACFTCVEVDAERTHSWYRPMQQHVLEVIGDRTINPCTAPVAGMIGNLAGLEAVKFLTGMADPVIRGRKLAIDLLHLDTAFAECERLDDCPDCGGAAA